MDQSNKRGRRSLVWRAVSFHSVKKKKDTDFRYYKSAQLMFVLIPLCLIEKAVQKRGCLFITAAAAAVCTPTSPIQPPAFIVAGNCAAGGKSRPAKLTILTSNERAGIVITNFLRMAIGLRWFPSIFPMAAGRPVRHARQRPPPPSPLYTATLAWQPASDASRWICSFASRLHQTAAGIPQRAFLP